MKLAFETKEKKQGLIFKKTLWQLEVKFEFSAEEITLIKKHSWDEYVMCKFQRSYMPKPMSILTGSFINENPHILGFDKIEELLEAKNTVIENAKILKNNLEVITNLTAGGSEEVEL